MKKNYFSLAILILFSTQIFSQNLLSGRVYDEKSNSPIENAEVHIVGTELGTITESDGGFRIETSQSDGNLLINVMGFDSQNIPFQIKAGFLNIGKIMLKRSQYQLDELVVSARIEKSNTPLTFSNIDKKEIAKLDPDQPLPLLMKSVPGIYATRNGGGSGDADLYLRGFDQENITLLLDGIPVNGIENGLVYWSNWIGLAPAFGKIQVQKGIGASILGVNSVGGTINIIPDMITEKKDNFINFSTTDYGNYFLSCSYQTPFKDKGWNVKFVGSRSWGDGFVEATYVDGWSYFLNIQKQFNSKHKINISLMGAPQHHGQRTMPLSLEEVQEYGYGFNKEWGYRDGKLFNASENFYHKPLLVANHQWLLNENLSLTNKVYGGFGTGGGRWSMSFNYAPTIFENRTEDNLIDWDFIIQQNKTHEAIYTLSDGTDVTGFSVNILSDFLASHYQLGEITALEWKINQHLKLSSGWHYRYFNSYLRAEVTDLLGGNVFIEPYAWAVEGPGNRKQLKEVGDIFLVDNNAMIHYANAFSHLSWSKNKLNAFLAANLNINHYQQDDRFNYIENTLSDPYIKSGFDIKGGMGYEISHYIFYVNGGYFSRVPYFKYVFGNSNNTLVNGLQNENILSFEAGSRIHLSNFFSEISLYHNLRKNVSLITDEYIQFESNQFSKAMVNGLNSRHTGIELLTAYQLHSNYKIGGIASLGNFEYQNNVPALIKNNNNIVVDTINVYAAGLKTGGPAQTQIGAFAEAIILDRLQLNLSWSYYDQIYALYNPLVRNQESDQGIIQSYQLPAYHLIDASVMSYFNLAETKLSVQLNCSNLLNEHFIENGKDGENHDLASFRGFWSMGRSFNLAMRLHF